MNRTLPASSTAASSSEPPAPNAAGKAPSGLFWIYVKLVLTAVIWGGTFIAGRIVAAEAAPFSAAFLRFLVAAAILGVLLQRSGGFPRLQSQQWLPVLLLGLTGVFLYNVFFFAGLETIGAGRASLIIATNPVLIALLAAVFFREPLGRLKLLGILLSVTGAMVVISRGDWAGILGKGIGRGELFILGCVASWVAYSLIGKIAMHDLSPFAAVTYSCIVGVLSLALPALREGLLGGLSSYSGATWMGLIYLGLFGSAVGFIWYYEGIRAIGPSRAGVFINIVPVSAIVFAYLMLGEPIDASLVAGAMLVSTGVYCTNRTQPAGKRAAVAAPALARRAG